MSPIRLLPAFGRDVERDLRVSLFPLSLKGEILYISLKNSHKEDCGISINKQ